MDLVEKIINNDGFLFMKNPDYENEFDDQVEVEDEHFRKHLHELDEEDFAELLFEYVLNETKSYADKIEKLVDVLLITNNFMNKLNQIIDQKVSIKNTNKNQLT